MITLISLVIVAGLIAAKLAAQFCDPIGKPAIGR
jgi:hypothetical protein